MKNFFKIFLSLVVLVIASIGILFVFDVINFTESKDVTFKIIMLFCITGISSVLVYLIGKK